MGIDEALEVVEPPEVLLLLLHVKVVGNKEGKGLVDATVLEVALHEDLEILVKGTKWRARVDSLGSVLGLGAVTVGELGVVVVEHVVDNNGAVLGNSVDVEGTLAGLLNDNVETDGSAAVLTHVLLVLGTLLVTESRVLVEHARLVVLEVGDGKGDGDPGVHLSAQGSRSKSCWGFNLLLVAKGALQDNVLLAGGIDKLKGAVLKEILDGGGNGLVGGNVLLIANLGGELLGELRVDLGGGSAEDGSREGLLGELSPENVAGSADGGAAEGDGGSRDGAESTGRSGARDSTKRHHLDGFGGGFC